MKNKKIAVKLIAVLLTVIFMAMTLASCAVGGASAANDASGEHGSLKWDYKKDGQTLTVTGTGAMANFEGNDDIAWGSVATSVKKIVVGEGITTVGNYAFFGMTALEEVTLPASLTSIGKLSFAFTPALKGIAIPGGVASIGYGAFENSGLTQITIPAGVTAIEANTFMYCDELASVTGNGVASVGDKAFAYCKALATLKLSNGAPTVAETAFAETAFTKENIKAADNKVTVTYKFVDAADTATEIANAASETRNIGETYAYTPPQIEGYVVVSNSINVVVGNTDQTVTVTYTKIATEPETQTPTEGGESDTAPVEPEDDKLEPMTVVALVVTVLIIIGIIVGTVLFIRHDKKNSGGKTVRKNKDGKKDKGKKK